MATLEPGCRWVLGEYMAKAEGEKNEKTELLVHI
jgi:hypothetical protein